MPPIFGGCFLRARVYKVGAMTHSTPVSRRNFIRGAGVTAVATATAGSVTPLEGHASERSPDSTQNTHPTFFTQPEWAFINAAVARLIPAEGPGPGGIAAGVPIFIDRQMESPYGHAADDYMQGPFHPETVPSLGYQLRYTPRELYKLGIAAADAACRKEYGKVFVELPADTQVQFLTAMERGSVSFDTPPAKVFFERLLKNTKEGYFADPLYGGNRDMGGWKLIGFPGARADFTDWIDQAGTKYPYGPVSIDGSRSP
jgi:gluconate 2-dehydrogenase gamma chain